MSRLNKAEQFVLRWHFSTYPRNRSFEEVLNAYEYHKVDKDNIPLVVSHDRYGTSHNRKSEVIVIRFMNTYLWLTRLQDAHQRAWQVAIDFYFDSYDNVAEIINAVINSLAKPDGAYLRDEYALDEWAVICNRMNELSSSIAEQILPRHTLVEHADRNNIMDLFRSDELLNQLSVDDRREVFLGILSGRDDITAELLNQLLQDYDVGHLQVLEVPVDLSDAPNT